MTFEGSPLTELDFSEWRYRHDAYVFDWRRYRGPFRKVNRMPAAERDWASLKAWRRSLPPVFLLTVAACRWPVPYLVLPALALLFIALVLAPLCWVWFSRPIRRRPAEGFLDMVRESYGIGSLRVKGAGDGDAVPRPGAYRCTWWTDGAMRCGTLTVKGDDRATLRDEDGRPLRLAVPPL